MGGDVRLIAVLVLAAMVSAFLGPVGALAAAGLSFFLVLSLAAARFSRGASVLVTAQAIEETEERAAIPTSWVIAAILAHWMMALALHSTNAGLSLAPDQPLYEMWGELLLANWESGSPRDLSGVVGYNELSIYYVANAVVRFFAGENTTFVISLFNGILATWAAKIASDIAGDLSGARAQKITFLLGAFWPSMVIHSSLNLRDALGWVFLMMVYASALRLRQSLSPVSAVTFIVGLAGVGLIRSYILVLLLVGLTGSLAVTRLKHIPYAAIFLLAIILASGLLGERFGLSSELLSMQSLELMESHRQNLNVGGSAAGDVGGDVSSLSGALQYLPRGLLFFLLSPFPWEIRNLRQMFIVPELLVWYVVIVLSARGVLPLFRRAPEVGVLAFPTMAICTAYALVEGNAGTANRHRAQVTLVFFIFAAEGLMRFLRRRDATRA